MNNGSMTSFNNFASNRNSTGSAFSLASDDFLRQQGPPPVPPPHSVPLKPLGASSASPSADFSRDSNGHGSNNNNSNRSSGVGINRSGTNSAIPRTPSPLRNAMDDVMYSLQTLELATSPGKDKHLAQFERSDSTASFRSPSIRESPAITAPAPLPPFSSRSAGRSPERDSGVMPFSSSSFGEPPFVAERRSPEREQTLPSSKATGVHRGGTRNSIIGSLSQKSVEDDKMRLNDSLILGIAPTTNTQAETMAPNLLQRQVKTALAVILATQCRLYRDSQTQWLMKSLSTYPRITCQGQKQSVNNSV